MEPTKIRIKELGQTKEIEITLEDFLKEIIAGLPITDNVNDEMRLSSGKIVLPSKLTLIEPQK